MAKRKSLALSFNNAHEVDGLDGWLGEFYVALSIQAKLLSDDNDIDKGKMQNT
jgi:hypothetical protein